jgi:Na+/H+ antiporter NhaD/arsenite permease-like protein
MPLWSVAPFVGLLLSIAVLPLAAPHWWHRNRNKALLSAGFGIPVAITVALSSLETLVHGALEYVAFVSLLSSLYVLSGGVRLRGSLAGTPASNAAFLAIGAVLANLVGTTGAAMLLIRPFLQANRDRPSKVHLVVFFIFLVANCGGCLTPLGDPPLFLGFLRGVPFAWTLRLWAPWLVVCGGLLVIFFLVDRRHFRRLPPRPAVEPEPFGIDGTGNLLLLAAVVGTILAGGFWVQPRFGGTAALLFQSLALAALAGVSLKSTPPSIRTANEFSWHPFVEVLVLFAGIFTTMIPALTVLGAYGSALNLTKPWQFFWMAGGLSAFLDNAPTYLAFLSMAQFLPDEVAGTTHATLAAISCGSVFLGAATYIGNGPNFMVKAIAEQRGVPMPSFFGYLVWSLLVLVPLLVATSLIFFR